MQRKHTKCLILSSGGIDSAVVLWWAKRKGWELYTLSFLFPGRRKKELWCSRKLAQLSGSRKNYEIPLPFLSSPKAREACYIPQRNLMYYGIAASLAEKINAQKILGGHFRHDGTVFSDARKNYFDRLNRLIHVRGKNKNRLSLVIPFIQSNKEQIIKTGIRLGVPFEYTWSCSHNGQHHCWKCSSCRERLSGFRKAGVEDPLTPSKSK